MENKARSPRWVSSTKFNGSSCAGASGKPTTLNIAADLLTADLQSADQRETLMQVDARCARGAHLARLDPALCDGSTYTSKHAADVSPAIRFRKSSLKEK